MFKLATEIKGKLTVIGDIHGQTDLLSQLLDSLRKESDFAERWIVFVGDFLDRGEDPPGALNLVLDLMKEHKKTTAVMGNHDFAILGALGLMDTPAENNWRMRYLKYYDSETTFRSYGVKASKSGSRYSEADLDDLSHKMPERHKKFLAALPWCVIHSEYLIVHAGILPNKLLVEQLEDLYVRDFSNNRPPWLCSRNLFNAPLPLDCLITVVSGHVWQERVVFGDRKILLDTSGGMGRNLSAVLLPEQRIIMV